MLFTYNPYVGLSNAPLDPAKCYSILQCTDTINVNVSLSSDDTQGTAMPPSNLSFSLSSLQLTIIKIQGDVYCTPHKEIHMYQVIMMLAIVYAMYIPIYVGYSVKGTHTCGLCYGVAWTEASCESVSLPGHRSVACGARQSGLQLGGPPPATEGRWYCDFLASLIRPLWCQNNR